MLLKTLIEKYDKNHKCLTPDAIYKTHVKNNSISIKVDLPMKLDLTEDQATDLEADLHYAIEKVLSKFF
jgi:hypothetical protein